MPPPTSVTARRRPPWQRRTLGWCAAWFAGSALLVGLTITPPDAWQGQPQRLMYLHVPAAWTAYAGFAAVAVASAGYLIRRDLRWDRYGRAAAEIGVVLTALTIGSGSLWGRAVWGVWWAWDPRLVSTAVLLLVYCGYLTGRGLGAGPHRAARRAAVLGLAGVALVPVVHFSVIWWRSLHQQATLLAPQASPPIHPLMVATLVLASGAFLTTAGWWFLRRVAGLHARECPAPTAAPLPDRAGIPPAALVEGRR